MAYRNDKSKYIKPNVSLSDDKGSVYYNYPPKPKANGHDYVDLGLSSGTLWATMNVGASKPSDAGLYFQWGDTKGYTADQVGKDKQFSWSDCKWRLSGNSYENIAFTKYTNTDDTLELEDDAAHANMGGDWHMPTPTQINELLKNTTKGWTTQDGVNGYKFTSKTDTSKSIFIPAAGSAWSGSLNLSGNFGAIWSSLLDAGNVRYGQHLYLGPVDVSLDHDSRCLGFSVRGVIG